MATNLSSPMFDDLMEVEYTKLNPPPLLVKYDEIRSIYFIEILDDPKWLPIGYIPTPKTHLGWFLYHLIHGLVMRYPVHKVLYYSLTNTAPLAKESSDD